MTATMYELRDASGVLVALHERHDHADGSKSFTWRQPDGTPGLSGLPVVNLPLYGIGRLDGTASTVVMVEGEKCAEALWSVGIAAVATVTGAASTPSFRVLAELGGWRAILWPDADAVGKKHMARIAERLAGVAGAVSVVEPPDGVPSGWDAADAVAEGRDVRAILAAAISWTGRVPDQHRATRGARVERISDVEREEVRPAWRGRLYFGKVTTLDGDPGLGKSTLLLDLAARVTTGRPMPDGEAGVGPADVVILSAEDGLADTIRPRLEAAQADLDRAFAITAVGDGDGERLPALPTDLTELERVIVEHRAVLVIVDPFVAYLPGTVNSHRDQDVRRAIAPLAALAERTGAAIVLVRHLTKSPGGPAIYRGGGSIGIVGAARSALLVAADPDDPDRRLLAPIKNNLDTLPAAFAFRIVEHPTLHVAMVTWEGATAHTADALLEVGPAAEESGALAEAMDVLTQILAEGPVPAEIGEAAALVAGVKESTLKRARHKLGVASHRIGGLGAGGHWEWSLAPKRVNEPLRGPSPEDGPLRDSMAPLAVRQAGDAVPTALAADGTPTSPVAAGVEPLGLFDALRGGIAAAWGVRQPAAPAGIDAPTTREWRCPIGPAHLSERRTDGSVFCATCHPPYRPVASA